MLRPSSAIKVTVAVAGWGFGFMSSIHVLWPVNPSAWDHLVGVYAEPGSGSQRIGPLHPAPVLLHEDHGGLGLLGIGVHNQDPGVRPRPGVPFRQKPVAARAVHT